MDLKTSSVCSEVKPDSPVDVRVFPRNLRHLLLRWSPPPTWDNLDIFPLKYQLRYQWENRGLTRTVHVRTIFTMTECETSWCFQAPSKRVSQRLSF